MPPDKGIQYPFLTRDMLNFEQGSQFQLVITSRGRFAANLTIQGATRAGLFTLRHTVVAGYGLTTQSFNIPDIPIWITVSNPDEGSGRGQTFVALNLAINGDMLHQLCAGYVAQRKGISWPVSQIETPAPQKLGHLTTRTGNDPAAGSEAGLTLGDFVTSEIKAIQFTLVTAATVGSRRVHIVFADSSGAEFDCHAGTDQIISETKKYTCMPIGGAASFANDNDIIIPIPPELFMNEGGTITTATVNIAGGDNFSAMVVLVNEFIN